MAAQRDAELLAYRAVAAVGRDEVAGAHRSLASVVSVLDDGRHAVGVLLERDELGALLEMRAERLGTLATRIGSRPIWVMNSRGDGLRLSTPSLMLRK